MMVTIMIDLDDDQQNGYCNDDQPDSRYNDNQKMTGGAPEVRSDKSLTLLTFCIRHSILDI